MRLAAFKENACTVSPEPAVGVWLRLILCFPNMEAGPGLVQSYEALTLKDASGITVSEILSLEIGPLKGYIQESVKTQKHYYVKASYKRITNILILLLWNSRQV